MSLRKRLYKISSDFKYLFISMKGKVLHWDINNEMLHGNFFTEKTGDNDIRIKMFQKAKELDPDSLRFANDFNVLLYDTDAYVNNFDLFRIAKLT